MVLNLELIQIVLQLTIERKSNIKIEDLLEVISEPKFEVIRCFSILTEINILKKNNVKDEFNGKLIAEYYISDEINAIDLTRAAQLGIDLFSFEKDLKINPKEKQLSLELSTQVEKLKQLDLHKRKPLLQTKRNYLSLDLSDEISENLFLILEAANHSLYDEIEELAKSNSNLNTLLMLHKEAENTLNRYTTQQKKI